MSDTPQSPIVDALNTAGSALGVSPTGKPLVSPQATKWIVLSTPLVGGLLALIPAHTIVGHFLHQPTVLGVLAGLGIGLAGALPGLRKKP